MLYIDLDNTIREIELADIYKIVRENYDTITRRGKGRYINAPASFDIETTSTYKGEEKVAFMYEWTFGIGKHIFIGREWKEFLAFVEALYRILDLRNNKLVVYVHNLSFEFQFIRKLFEWREVFSNDTRNPIKATTTNNIEFRCSYVLSNQKLETLAKNLRTPIKKLKGDLDYSKVRTYKTPLSNKELQYCINDVRILLLYIQEQIEEYGNITNIPLTNTGRVREYCRKNCLEATNKEGKKCRNINYVRNIKALTIDKHIYDLSVEAFRGGYTHANLFNSMMKLSDVKSHDLESAYPSIIVKNKFPSSQFYKLSKEEIENNFYDYLEQRCCLIRIQYNDLEIKDNAPDSYISYIPDKIKVKNCGPLDNGRIRTAESLEITITEVDFNIIEKLYNYSNFEVVEMYVAFKYYLRKELIMSCLYWYKLKTELKGVEGKEQEYRNAKNMLNAIYGMMIQSIYKIEDIYEGNEWKRGYRNNKDDVINSYNSNSKRFTYYPVGIWITAYCREEIIDAMINIGKDDYVYCDTDCVKYLGNHDEYFKEFNNKVRKELEEVAKVYNIPFEYMTPKQGHMLGMFDYEGNSKEFKTLGAKRYMKTKEYEYGRNRTCPLKFINKIGKFEGNKFIEYETTIAGVSKSAAKYIMENGGFSIFNQYLVIPAKDSGKLVHTYLDNEFEGEIVDYLGNKTIVKELSSVHLEYSEFSLGMEDEYIDMLDGLLRIVEDVKIQ